VFTIHSLSFVRHKINENPIFIELAHARRIEKLNQKKNFGDTAKPFFDCCLGGSERLSEIQQMDVTLVRPPWRFVGDPGFAAGLDGHPQNQMRHSIL
jgi:hypothetical protein